MSDPLFVGVDLGTQSVKVCIVDGSGEVVARASRPLVSTRSGVRHEQDPTDWITGTRGALGGAIAALAPTEARRIAALSLC